MPTLKASSPMTALGRIQDLAGRAKGIAHNDRNPERLSDLVRVLDEIYAVALASRMGERLPDPYDPRKTVLEPYARECKFRRNRKVQRGE